MAKKRTRNITSRLKWRLWKSPCAVCGVPYSICCDHVVPYSKGGETHEDNLQPLCVACNGKKSNRLNNDALARWVLGRGVLHFLKAIYEEDTKYFNTWDGPGFEQWRKHSSRIAEAHALYEAFLMRNRSRHG